MAYNTTGKSHENGLKGEKLIEKLFRLMKGRCFGLDEILGEFVWIESKGGTIFKDDSIAHYAKGSQGISTKHRTTGTFDWMNTTQDIKAIFPELSALVDVYKGKFKGRPKCEKTVAELRELFAEESQKALLGLPSEEIRKVVLAAIAGTQEQFVAVVDKKADFSERYKGFYGQHHPEYKVLESKNYELFFMQPGGAKTSAQIWARNLITGEEHNTDWRARLVLNNGVGAWLGGKGWSSNYGSVLCFKIQQDSVPKLFQKLSENGHLRTQPEIA